MTKPTNLVSIKNNEENKDIQKLKTFGNLFCRNQGRFKVGDIVKRIPGAYVGKFPRDDQPCIVMDIFNEPVKCPNFVVGNSHGAIEQVDMLLGLLDPDGEIVTFHFDSRFFTYY